MKDTADIAYQFGLSAAQRVGRALQIEESIIHNSCILAKDAIGSIGDCASTDSSERVSLQPGGVGGASSTKPSNVCITWPKVVRDLSVGKQVLAPLVIHPILFCVALLGVAAKTVDDAITLELGEREASVYWALICTGATTTPASFSDILTSTAQQRSLFALPTLTENEIGDALTTLHTIGCVASPTDEGTIVQKSWVIVEDFQTRSAA